jgi:hypothetical protein
MAKMSSSQYLNRIFMALPHTNPARGGIILEEFARVGIKMLLRNATGFEPAFSDAHARFKLDTTRRRLFRPGSPCRSTAAHE